MIIYGLYYFFSEYIKLSEVLPITIWDNLRWLGLTFASHIAVPFAAIGYFLSSRRTQAMQKGNDVQSSMKVSSLFIDSQKLIDENGVAAIGAISVLADIGKKSDDLRDACKSQLIARLETHAQKDGDGQRPGGDKFPPHIETALNGLCELQSRYYGNWPANNIELTDLDFSNVRLQSAFNMAAFIFTSCSFQDATLNNITFDETCFLNCDFSSASLAYCEFLFDPTDFHETLEGSSLTDTNISGINFSGIQQMTSGPLSECRYLKHSPPTNLSDWACDTPLTGIILPTPWERAGLTNNLDDDRYMTLDEAEDFWSSDDNDQYRPRDRDGEPIEIIDPYKDDST